MFRIVILALSTSIAACATMSGGQAITAFESEPTGALVKVEGVGECETPCTVGHREIISVTVAKAGFLKQSFQVKPGAKKVKVILELAAPSDEVAEETLPEL